MIIVLLFLPMEPTLAGQRMYLNLVAYAHFGVLSVLAIVLGFAVDYYDVRGYSRSSVVVMYGLVQWLLPLTLLAAAFVSPQAGLATFAWGSLLFIAMAIMLRMAWSGRR
jgi:hypothetical protein